MDSCVFCNLNPSFYIAKNDLCYAVKDINPKTKGHSLIITKRHFQDFFDVSEKEISAMKSLAKEVKEILEKEDNSITGYNIVFNSGVSSGQIVPHLHMHILPRRNNDKLEIGHL